MSILDLTKADSCKNKGFQTKKFATTNHTPPSPCLSNALLKPHGVFFRALGGIHGPPINPSFAPDYFHEIFLSFLEGKCFQNMKLCHFICIWVFCPIYLIWIISVITRGRIYLKKTNNWGMVITTSSIPQLSGNHLTLGYYSIPPLLS